MYATAFENLHSNKWALNIAVLTKRQMGHATTKMLFRVYSHYVQNLTRQDGSAFERLITQAKEQGE